MYGYYRIASGVNITSIGEPKANLKEILTLLHTANQKEVSVIVFPELTFSGYSASDLFLNKRTLDAQNNALEDFLNASKEISTVAVLGVAVLFQNRLYNCAIVTQNGEILGVIPKTYLPNKREFYEKRQFNSGKDIKNQTLTICNQSAPFGVDLLFSDNASLILGVEICEDLWAINPPSNMMCSNGATLIANLSASNELVGKGAYREELVRTQSARCMCAYAYSSSGVGESSSDTVFSGDSMICEYGSMVAKGEKYQLQSSLITADVDLEKLTWLRINESSFCDEPTQFFREIKLKTLPTLGNIERFIDAMPFVPCMENLQSRAKEILDIQAYALIKRLTHTRIQKVVIGISGGLDSTLALLSLHRAYELMGWDNKNIVAITMPGFGTTKRTKNNAKELCKILGVTLEEIDIRAICLLEFEALEHSQINCDVTYENVQARARTSILMNTANKVGGVVIGTGDLSEIALGWSTFNGDHMSMYALNSGIPKTLIKYVVEYFKSNAHLTAILQDILDTPISPELLPPSIEKGEQKTEDLIGPYILHDFFLYHFMKYGATPSKILFLATIAFKDVYSKEIIQKWLILFIKRFFTQQFKRNTMPDGPKIGTINLSQRADWRMPSDANAQAWLEDIL